MQGAWRSRWWLTFPAVFSRTVLSDAYSSVVQCCHHTSYSYNSWFIVHLDIKKIGPLMKNMLSNAGFFMNWWWKTRKINIMSFIYLKKRRNEGRILNHWVKPVVFVICSNILKIFYIFLLVMATKVLYWMFKQIDFWSIINFPYKTN